MGDLDRYRRGVDASARRQNRHPAWRNLHNARSLAVFGLAKGLALNLMYNSFWLASPRDALYNASGRVICR